jgi:CHAD domain-containing protein
MQSNLARVIRRHLRMLMRHWARARKGHARSIHRVRVASRRLREALPVAAAAAPDRAASIRHDVRRVTSALGTVRELEVARREFDADLATRGWHGAIVDRVREHLEEEQARRDRRSSEALDRIRARRLDGRVNRLADEVDEAKPRGWEIVLGARVRRRAKAFAAALRAAGTLYAAEPIHAVRIAGKKLRYTLELAHDATGLTVGRERAVLERLQDLLGRLRDLQILQSHIHLVAAEAAGDALAPAALDDMHAVLESECRAIHARFLGRLPRLLAMADRVARETPATLATRSARKMLRMRSAAAVRAPRTATA